MKSIAEEYAIKCEAASDAPPPFTSESGVVIAKVTPKGELKLITRVISGESAIALRDWITIMFEKPKMKPSDKKPND